MKIQIVHNATDTFSRFLESSGIVILLILIGVFIMIGAFYGAKLWYDIKEIRKYLKNRESDPEQDAGE